MSDPQPQTSRDTHQLPERVGDIVKPEMPLKRPQTDGSDQPLYLLLVEAQVIRQVELHQELGVILWSYASSSQSLEHHPQYEAISYVWGGPTITVPILCNGRILDITANLKSAFLRVRYSDLPRICVYSGFKRAWEVR